MGIAGAEARAVRFPIRGRGPSLPCLVGSRRAGYNRLVLEWRMGYQRILLVDDHEVVRVGLRSLLEQHPQFQVVAEAATAREAVEKTGAHKPDVVVMDIRLKGGSGIEACQEITTQYPETKVIMLTSYAEDEMLFSAIRP